ncbi:MAG: RuBisCO large subunit C-terminal-like domain-containing protein [Candidatus ainarchaeum sp.]|nr:RuBisCO large subunit C-terminal-like domain-containing protein [Candidatus ainarchaeum sp.]
MAYGGYSYTDLKYKPDPKNDFVVLFWTKSQMNIEKTAEALAAESSVGSWTRLRTMNNVVWEKYRARVFWIGKVSAKSGFIKIAYPIEHFDVKNLSQFQASVLGNVFGLKELEELYVFDISIPKNYQKRFKGAALGLGGIRKLVGTEKTKRPHMGTIVKPKVGLTPKEWANVAYKSYLGGLDLVKDDENLVDQKFCKWKERLNEVVNAIEKAEGETGQHHIYSSSITDKQSRMIERVDYLNEMGLNKKVIVMLDIYILGLSTVEEILEITRKYKFAIHGHRAGFAAANRGSFGVNFQVYEKFYRLLGIDQLHVGTGVGKMEGSPLAIKRLHELAENFSLKEKLYFGSLEMEFEKNIKPILSIASGGVDAGKVDAIIALHGKNTNIQAGAGVHGHSGGTVKGAISMKQAVEAVMKGVAAPEYAKTHPELSQALKIWGYSDPKEIYKEIEYERKNYKKMTLEALKKGRAGVIF